MTYARNSLPLLLFWLTALTSLVLTGTGRLLGFLPVRKTSHSLMKKRKLRLCREGNWGCLASSPGPFSLPFSYLTSEVGEHFQSLGTWDSYFLFSTSPKRAAGMAFIPPLIEKLRPREVKPIAYGHLAKVDPNFLVSTPEFHPGYP